MTWTCASCCSGRSAFRYIAQRCPIRSLKAIPTANNIKIVVGGQDGLIRQVKAPDNLVHLSLCCA
jgi:hypothetical protein